MNWDGRQSVFDHLGNPMPEDDAADNTEILWTIIEQAMKHSNDHSADISNSKSLYDYFEEKVAEMFPYQVEKDAEVERKRQTILRMAEMWGAFVGSPIQTQSLKFFWLEECIDGENLFVADTYHKVLEKIAEPAFKGAEVRFQKRVHMIRSGSEKAPDVIVEIDSGERLTFDEVVTTTPLGWLKRNSAAFTPALPSRLKEAIDSIGYGHLDKVSLASV
jgi:hypothetical protein